MKLPCWIKHDWDMYGERYDRIYTACYRYDELRPIETWKERRTFQDRVCKRCGIIQSSCVNVTKIEEN